MEERRKEISDLVQMIVNAVKEQGGITLEIKITVQPTVQPEKNGK